jgi:hypothetical protein
VFRKGTEIDFGNAHNLDPAVVFHQHLSTLRRNNVTGSHLNDNFARLIRSICEKILQLISCVEWRPAAAAMARIKISAQLLLQTASSADRQNDCYLTSISIT